MVWNDKIPQKIHRLLLKILSKTKANNSSNIKLLVQEFLTSTSNSSSNTENLLKKKQQQKKQLNIQEAFDWQKWGIHQKRSYIHDK